MASNNFIRPSWVFLVAQLVKNPPAMWETWVPSLGWEDPLEKGKATHSSILAWRIPWTWSQRVGQGLSDFHLKPTYLFREKGTLLHCWWECKLVQPLWRTVWRFLKKPGNRTAVRPSNPTSGIHTKEIRIERDTCNLVFIGALFIIARTWKQPRCPSADKWIKKLWYIYTMEYYSAIKKNTFESVLMRWMKLEPIIQSEVSQNEKHQYSILMHIYGI